MFSSKLQKYIQNGDKERVSSLIISQLDSDRFQEKMEVEAFQKEIPEDFFEEDSGSFTILMQEQWTGSYWTSILVALFSNFSKEKLIHAIEVVHYLRQQGDSDFQTILHTKSSATGTGEKVYSPNSRRRRVVATCGGTTLVGAVVGGLVASNALAGVGVGAGLGLAVGIAYVTCSKKNSV